MPAVLIILCIYGSIENSVMNECIIMLNVPKYLVHTAKVLLTISRLS